MYYIGALEDCTWVKLTSPEGYPFYLNQITNEWQWELRLDLKENSVDVTKFDLPDWWPITNFLTVSNLRAVCSYPQPKASAGNLYFFFVHRKDDLSPCYSLPTDMSRMTSLLDKINSSLPPFVEPVTKWKRFYDPATSRYYFFNTEDESIQWEIPEEWEPPDAEVAQVCTGPSPSPCRHVATTIFWLNQ